jgi:hypothetical protein
MPTMRKGHLSARDLAQTQSMQGGTKSLRHRQWRSQD